MFKADIKKLARQEAWLGTKKTPRLTPGLRMSNLVLGPPFGSPAWRLEAIAGAYMHSKGAKIRTGELNDMAKFARDNRDDKDFMKAFRHLIRRDLRASSYSGTDAEVQQVEALLLA